MYERVFSLG